MGADMAGKMREVEIKNEYGLHARPAAMFVKTAARYEADLLVEKDGTRVPGKSIMALLTLQACCGSVLRLIAEGEDAEPLLDELESLVKREFDDVYN